MLLTGIGDICVGRSVGRNDTPEIDTAPKRRRLLPRRNPYWIPVAGGRGGLSLGYRRVERGAGAWVAKLVTDGERAEERIGTADDEGAEDESLSFRLAVSTALDWSVRQAASLEERVVAQKSVVPTVRFAVEAYILKRLERSAAAGANAKVRLAKHVLGDRDFAETALKKLRSTIIESWRCRLPEKLAPTTINRLLNDLRAALNDACEKHRRILPAGVIAEIKVGTRRLSTPSSARKQILTDAQIQALLAAAWEGPDADDFGPLVMLAAATGARFSQLAALTVGDVQFARGRVMVPSSRKGRAARPKAPIPIPLSDSVLRSLRPLTEDRSPDQTLLETWAYKRVRGTGWKRTGRRPWGAACETEKLWAAAVARSDLPPGAIMYSLRHSSIVRGLCGGLPIRLVAAAHDTSVEMIEAHYAAHIVDATEELHRRLALSISG